MKRANTVNQSRTPATDASRRAGYFFDTSFWHHSGGHNLLADKAEYQPLFWRDTNFWHHLAKACQDRLLCEGMWRRREANYAQAPKPSISARHSGCFYKNKYQTPQKKLVDKSCRKWCGKAGLMEQAFLFQFTLPISSFCGHEILQVTKQPDEREIPLFPSVCLPLLPVVKVWEISSLLCSRNCALRTAEGVVYTIYI